MMHVSGMLPLSYWGLGRGPNRKAALDEDVVSRLGMGLFFERFAHLAPASPLCLEWGPAHFSKLIQSCTDDTTWQFRMHTVKDAFVLCSRCCS